MNVGLSLLNDKSFEIFLQTLQPFCIGWRTRYSVVNIQNSFMLPIPYMIIVDFADF